MFINSIFDRLDIIHNGSYEKLNSISFFDSHSSMLCFVIIVFKSSSLFSVRPMYMQSFQRLTSSKGHIKDCLFKGLKVVMIRNKKMLHFMAITIQVS